MATTLKNFVLLVLLAGPGLGWENLPSIPAGRRAEYYLQEQDGSYKYGYDTGAGQSAKVDANHANEVQGHFSYVNNDGQQVSLKYSAGEGGYVPQLDGVPAPGAAPGSSAGHAASIGSGITTYGAPSQEANGQVDADYDANADASYNFNIDTDSYKRTESSDSRGNIRGQYSYNSREGGSHGLSYIAGEGTGFVVTGTSGDSGIGAGAGAGAPGVHALYASPAAPATPYSGPASNGQGSLNHDGSYSFSYNTADQSRQEAADAQNNVRGSYSFRAKDDGQTRRVDYEAGATTGFVARGAHLPVAPSAGAPGAPGSLAPLGGAGPYSAPSATTTLYSGPASNSQGALNSDGSYSFSYNAPDHTRVESADAQNNVRGSFSFTAKDDGQTRKVDYEAGSDTGFIAHGAHLPVAPSAGTSTPGASGAPISAYSGILAPGAPSALATPYSGPASNSQGAINPDGSYSFSFSTGEQSRQESADAQNNVRGSYSFKAKDDGQTRRVDYEAGAATGFVARGDHLPVAPSGAVAGSVAPLGGLGGAGPYSAPGAPAISYSVPASNAQGDINPDGSYSFSYNTDEHSRQESADAQNNVRGSYSFRAKDDGQTRRVDYEAGAATGFTARGDHLPVAPSAGADSAPGGFSGLGAGNPYSAPGSPSGSASDPGVDGSYSFSYNTGDQSRQEASDSQGNVRGSFSFVAKDDGQTRRVDYEAGAEKGFIAKGAHLPVAPSGAPGAGVGGAAPSGGAVPINAYLAPSGASGSGPNYGQDNGDGSYSYSYQTDSSSKSESADTQGNVQGVFSYTGDDGVSRSLSYTSRGDDGFIASGDHLPKAPVAGAAVPLGGAPSSLAPTGTGGYGRGAAHSSLGAPAAGGHTPYTISGTGFILNKYLPPQSTHKFGYIFDTKA